MKEKYIANLKTNEDVTEYYLVKSAALKVGSNRKTYLDVLLCDKTGEISGKKWDVADEEAEGLDKIKEGCIIKVRATVTEWNNLKQLKISRIRMTGAEDNIDITDFIKAAPEKPEDMYDFIYGKASAFEDEEFRSLCTSILENNRDRLLYYPAASKNHHAELGGLLYHTKRMLMSAERLCEVYPILDRELLMTGVIIHDIEKLNEIESNEMGISPGYSFEGKMLGHLVMGVRELDKIAGEMGMSRERAVMLEHMMLSHHYEPEFGSPKKPLFPEAEMLHYLDMIDAKMYDMEEAIEKTEPGEFSERVWTLDNRTIYRREEHSQDETPNNGGLDD
ncbi:MAG: HD domain-containing protein [Firmicutes bacterium]|nr:HD domain-containing protein [Bacillota bacterium]